VVSNEWPERQAEHNPAQHHKSITLRIT
jgi:hypothetical protein